MRAKNTAQFTKPQHNMRWISILILTLILNMVNSHAAPKIAYYVSMSEPHTHYFDVEMRISDFEKQDSLTVKMAVWTPGSYLVREFSRKIEAFAVTNNNKTSVKHRKVAKNAWRLYPTTDADEVRIRYKVYSYEHTVRTSYLDAHHGYINGASVFLYLDGMQQLPSTIHIQPHESFKEISTALKPVNTANKWVLTCPNFDTLVDSPIEIGNQEIVHFEAEGIPHHLAIYGDGNYDSLQLVKDTKKIVKTATNIFGEHPCEDYTIIVHNTAGAYGGLEHLHSTSLIYPRWNYKPKKKYNRWLGLMSHEYFHLWNVKRIRPIELGPFDYERENYTQLLWVMEGSTSYYDDYILRRAGLLTADEYLDIVASNFSKLENKPGNKVQPVAEASFDAWIKYYRSDENTHNCCVSYYLKGAVLHILLDLEILHQSKGQKSLDDVMRYLYKEFYQNKKRGFTDAEYKMVVEKMAGISLDDFFDKYVYGTDSIDYAKYLDYAGLEMTNRYAGDETLSLGLNLKNESGKLMVQKVTRGTCGYDGGLNAFDELIAIDNYRIDDKGDIDKLLENKKRGDKIKVMVARDGQLKEFEVSLQPSPYVSFKISKQQNMSDDQKTVLKAWLNKK